MAVLQRWLKCRDWFFRVLGREGDIEVTHLEFPHQPGDTNRSWVNDCSHPLVQAHTHSPGEQHRTINASISSQPAAPRAAGAGLSASGADTGTRWQMGKGRPALCRYKQETCEARVPVPVNFVPVWSSSGCDYLECVRAEERRMGEKLSSCLSHHCCRFPLLIYCPRSWGVQREVNES